MFKHLATSRGSTVNKAIYACLFVLMISLFIFTNLTSAEILFWTFFVAMFVWNIDAKVSLAGALFFLVIIPLLTILDRLNLLQQGETWSEFIAVWVFYFLAIGVLKQLWDTVIENKKTKPVKKPPVSVPTYIEKNEPSFEGKTDNRVKRIHAKHDVVVKKVSKEQ